MANFKTTIITKKGHALMAKLSANVATMKFTKVCSSDFDYSNLNNSELEQVITFKNLKQTVLPDLITVVNTATVKVSATITNTNLNEGYYLRTIGLFALDPDDGEILYSITPTTEADYMAADNGITKSGISLELLTTISNSENVSLEVDPNAMISAETFNTVVGNVSDLENGSTNLVDGINKNTAYLNDIGQQKANKVAIPPVYMGVFFESNENTGNNIFLTGDGKNLIKINDNNIFNGRDTSVMACNGKFYFASTNSNEINKIVINATSDLENYETTFITLNNDTNLAVWAPDWFIDDDGKIYILYSLQVGTELGGNSVTYKDMRQYIVEITDLETLTIGTPRALNLTGDSKNSDNRIDGTIVKKDGTYYLFIKYNSMTGDGNPNGAIEIWTSTDLVVWTCINERINDLMGLEAPCICKINDIYYLYVDDFTPFNYADSSLVSNGGATMYLTSTDLVTWSSTPVMVNSSVSLRHGSIVQIYDEDCKRVILSKSLPKLLNLNYENQSRVKTLESLTDLTGIYNNIQFIMSASTAYSVYRGFIPLKNASNYTITLTKMAYMDTDVVEVTSTATIGEKNALGFMVHNTNANVAGKVCLLWFSATKIS